MQINVAGAGAGKTTKMADLIAAEQPIPGKIIFCVAFTNAAVQNIEEKVTAQCGRIPDHIKISTIHSFLYQEMIDPYYHFLFGRHFEKLSNIALPNDDSRKNSIISELRESNILHISKIPEYAKWVVFKKSDDRKPIKETRKKVLSIFSKYCAKIFVDEAQDIDKHMMPIFEALNDAGIEIVLYGDPKQDIRGRGYFQEMISSCKNVVYIPECYRCPQKHLDFSNLLACEEQRQIAADSNAEGSIEIIFESTIADIKSFIDKGHFGLCYISRKTDRYNTHKVNNDRFDSLFYQVHELVFTKCQGDRSNLEISRAAYFATESILRYYDLKGDFVAPIKQWESRGLFGFLTKKQYGRIGESLKNVNRADITTPIISSIESIKGLEADRCLFILTSDLAPYLFNSKSKDNKMRHLLYVALTRSLNHLTILIANEVEEKYSKESIRDFFNKHGVDVSEILKMP